MSVRAKFLAGLKKNASEGKKSAPSCTSYTASTDDARRSKRKHIGDSSNGPLRDGTRAFDRQHETKTISRTSGEQTFKMPYAVHKNETNPGLVEHENTIARNRRVEGFHGSNEAQLQGDGRDLREFGMRIKQEPFDENKCRGNMGNDDFSFLISLLPHISNIPPELKLRFRNRVNDVVDEFAYSNITKSKNTMEK